MIALVDAIRRRVGNRFDVIELLYQPAFDFDQSGQAASIIHACLHGRMPTSVGMTWRKRPRVTVIGG